MNIMISNATNGVINRFLGPTAGGGSGAGRVIRPSGLTSRDIEAKALVRLTRRGYDWPGRPKRGRKTS
jgi:hypothetical protein